MLGRVNVGGFNGAKVIEGTLQSNYPITYTFFDGTDNGNNEPLVPMHGYDPFMRDGSASYDYDSNTDKWYYHCQTTSSSGLVEILCRNYVDEEIIDKLTKFIIDYKKFGFANTDALIFNIDTNDANTDVTKWGNYIFTNYSDDTTIQTLECSISTQSTSPFGASGYMFTIQGDGDTNGYGIDIYKIVGEYNGSSIVCANFKDGDIIHVNLASDLSTNAGIYVNGELYNIDKSSLKSGDNYLLYDATNGFTYVNDFVFSGNAVASDVASGKTFYSNNGTLKTGTATLGSEVYVNNVLSSFKKVYITQETVGDFWETKTAMPTKRNGLRCGAVNNQIYCIGGNIVANNECYNPNTNSWITKQSIPTAVHSFGIAVYNNQIYCIGGYTSGTQNATNNQCYNPSTNTWATKTSMPTGRRLLASGVVNGQIYCFGGYSSASSSAKNNECYNPSTNTWTTKTSMPTGRKDLGCGVVDGKIYCIGGTSQNVNECYNPTTNTWTTKEALPFTPDNTGSPTAGEVDGKIYFIVYTYNYWYDVSTNTWANKTAMPTYRTSLGSAVVNNNVYVIGGFGTSSTVNKNECYTPSYDRYVVDHFVE